jgi:hypothetical protein
MNTLSQKSFDSIKNSLEIILDKDLISSDQYKKAKNDFLKSPSDYSVQYRYGMAMVHSKDKSNIEEGLKLLKELCLLNTLPESCMCYYHICFGSLRLHRFEDVQFYAERVREGCPKLMPDEITAYQLIEKTEQLVILAEEFIQNPHLSKLLEIKRKRKIKGLWRSKKENEKILARQPSIATQVQHSTPKEIILSDGTNVSRKNYSLDTSYTTLPSLVTSKKSTPLYNTLCIRNNNAKRPRNQTPLGVKSCVVLPEYQDQSDTPDENDGESLMELKESLTQLREMYNNTFGISTSVTCDIPTISDTSFQTPKSTLSSQLPLDDLKALSEEDLHSDFPPKSSSQETIKKIQSPLIISNSGLPKTTLQPTSRRKGNLIKSSTMVVERGARPWVIIRRYGMRGGKKIRLPHTLAELLQIAGQKFLIDPVSIREVSTEAEIEEISAIDPQAILWVMTEQDELLFQ